MRIFVQNGGQNYVIPCKDSTATVATLKREVLARCLARPEDESKYYLVLRSSDAVLCDCDTVQDVLRDGDSIALRELWLAIGGLHYDLTHPHLSCYTY